MSQMAELEARYASEMLEKERAALEAQIWSLVPRELRTEKHGLPGYMKAKLGASTHAARARQFLHRAGAAADPLWERVHRDMTLSTALTLMQDAYDQKAAKNLLKKGVQEEQDALSEAVLACIKAYDESGYAANGPDGKVVRRRKQIEVMDAPPPPVDVPSGRAFWPFLRQVVSQYVKTRLEGCDPVQVEFLIRKFEVDLNVVIEDLQDEVRKVPRGSLEAVAFSRARVIHECRTLGMDPPKPGQPVDARALQLQYKRASRAYHPDMHGGDETTLPQFKAVQDAKKFLAGYNESLKAAAVPSVEPGRPHHNPGNGD